MANSDGFYEVYWPRALSRVGVTPLAKRLDTLEGKKVAQMWDFVFRGDEVYVLLEEGLKRRFPGVQFVSWREIGNTHGPEETQIIENLPRRLKEMGVDAVISGIGA